MDNRTINQIRDNETKLINEIKNLEKENQELNKQVARGIDLVNQQKEFIDYLTSYIKLLKDKPDLIEDNQKDILEEVFERFKEIIGDDK